MLPAPSAESLTAPGGEIGEVIMSYTSTPLYRSQIVRHERPDEQHSVGSPDGGHTGDDVVSCMMRNRSPGNSRIGGDEKKQAEEKRGGN